MGEAARPVGEAAGTGGETVPPHAHGESAPVSKRWTATTGILAPCASSRPGPGHGSFLSRPAVTGPHTKETFGVKLAPKAPVWCYRRLVTIGPHGMAMPHMT